MKNILTNRFFLGSLCVLIAALLAFFISPQIEKSRQAEIITYIVSSPIENGEQITETDIQEVAIPLEYLPTGSITEKEKIIGKYATVNLIANEYFFAEKLSTAPTTETPVYETIGSDKLAISLTLKTFASGMSANLQPEDIVSVIAAHNDDETYIPEILQFVRVLSVTTSTAADYDASAETLSEEVSTQDLPVTVTLEATPTQATLLADLEVNANVHFALVSRGDNDRASDLLGEQTAICEEIIAQEFSGTDTQTNIEEKIAKAPTA